MGFILDCVKARVFLQLYVQLDCSLSLQIMLLDIKINKIQGIPAFSYTCNGVCF